MYDYFQTATDLVPAADCRDQFSAPYSELVSSCRAHQALLLQQFYRVHVYPAYRSGLTKVSPPPVELAANYAVAKDYPIHF